MLHSRVDGAQNMQNTHRKISNWPKARSYVDFLMNSYGDHCTIETFGKEFGNIR